jgi:hypothetical protein
MNGRIKKSFENKKWDAKRKLSTQPKILREKLEILGSL